MWAKTPGTEAWTQKLNDNKQQNASYRPKCSRSWPGLNPLLNRDDLWSAQPPRVERPKRDGAIRIGGLGLPDLGVCKCFSTYFPELQAKVRADWKWETHESGGRISPEKEIEVEDGSPARNFEQTLQPSDLQKSENLGARKETGEAIREAFLLTSKQRLRAQSIPSQEPNPQVLVKRAGQAQLRKISQ